MENIQNLQRGAPTVIASEPYCVVVAGDCVELNSSEKKASFERFRERLNGVRILTLMRSTSVLKDCSRSLQTPPGSALRSLSASRLAARRVA